LLGDIQFDQSAVADFGIHNLHQLRHMLWGPVHKLVKEFMRS
jgi:hypothetical protein